MVHMEWSIAYFNLLFVNFSRLSRINRDDRFIVACNEFVPIGFSEINIWSIVLLELKLKKYLANKNVSKYHNSAVFSL